MDQIGALRPYVEKVVNLGGPGDQGGDEVVAALVFDWSSLVDESRRSIREGYHYARLWSEAERWQPFAVATDFKKTCEDLFDGYSEEFLENVGRSSLISMAVFSNPRGLWCLSRTTGEVWLADDGSFSRRLPSLGELWLSLLGAPEQRVQLSVPPAEPKFAALEYRGDEPGRFWRIDVQGNGTTIRFGRIGTRGAERTGTYPDPAVATREAEKRVTAKLRQGYVMVETSSKTYRAG